MQPLASRSGSSLDHPPAETVERPSSLEIRLLGPFRVFVDKQPVEESRWRRRKAKVLVKLLALEPHHQMHREQLMEALWPELDPDAALANLHKAIHAARRALEPTLQQGTKPTFIITEGQQVVLRASKDLWIDADGFRLQAAEALKSDDPDSFESALALYEGDLLIEDLYEDWAAAPRARLCSLRRDLLMRVAALYEERSVYDKSAERSKESIKIDPANEEAHCRLMRLYALMGKKSEAARQFKQCADSLQRELGVEPDPSTRELHNRILTGQIRPIAQSDSREESISPSEPASPGVDNEKNLLDQDEYGSKEEAGRLTRVADRLFELESVQAIASARSDQGRGRNARLYAIGAIVLVMIVVAAFSLRALKSRDQSLVIDSLAVMPFANEGEEPDSDYLSDGITETLIDRFSRLPGLRMRARNTTFQYKGKQFDPLQLGTELKVKAILIGSVSKRGERLIIKAELIDTRDGSRLWSDEHNRPGTEILVAQQEIVRGVTKKLRLRVTDDDNAAVDRRYMKNTEAYEAYLKGRYFLNRRTVEGGKKAVEFFEQALYIDPFYAPAYAGLSDCYALGGASSISPREWMPLAKAAARRALELDDQLAEAHTSLGFIAEYYDWDFELAESEFRRAIELNPNYATARHWYAEFLAFLGRHDEAIREVELAQELDPLSLSIPVDLGVIYHYARRYDRAIEQFEKIASLTSNRANAHGWLMLLHFENGMPEKAESEYRKAMELSVHTPSELFNYSLDAHFHALAGNRKRAKKALEELKRDSERRHDWEIAQVLAILDEKDESLALLEGIYEKRGGSLISLKVNRFFDNLRSDSRFTDLLRRVGFTQ